MVQIVDLVIEATTPDRLAIDLRWLPTYGREQVHDDGSVDDREHSWVEIPSFFWSPDHALVDNAWVFNDHLAQLGFDWRIGWTAVVLAMRGTSDHLINYLTFFGQILFDEAQLERAMGLVAGLQLLGVARRRPTVVAVARNDPSLVYFGGYLNAARELQVLGRELARLTPTAGGGIDSTTLPLFAEAVQPQQLARVASLSLQVAVAQELGASWPNWIFAAMAKEVLDKRGPLGPVRRFALHLWATRWEMSFFKCPELPAIAPSTTGVGGSPHCYRLDVKDRVTMPVCGEGAEVEVLDIDPDSWTHR